MSLHSLLFVCVLYLRSAITSCRSLWRQHIHSSHVDLNRGMCLILDVPLERSMNQIDSHSRNPQIRASCQWIELILTCVSDDLTLNISFVSAAQHIWPLSPTKISFIHSVHLLFLDYVRTQFSDDDPPKTISINFVCRSSKNFWHKRALLIVCFSSNDTDNFTVSGWK